MSAAADTDHEVDTLLVDHAREVLEERPGGESDAVQDRVVLKPASHERANPAAAEDVIQHEGGLSESATLLIVAHLEVLEAGESAGLHVAPAVDETDIELAFLAPGVVHEFALRLDGALAVAAERGEVPRGAIEGEVAGAGGAEGRSDVQAHHGELLVAA